MATLFIYKPGDIMPEEHRDFFAAFPADEHWEYFILGYDYDTVTGVARKMNSADMKLVHWPNGMYGVVTYSRLPIGAI